MSTRREFITLLGGTAVACRLRRGQQPADRVRRIGVLSNVPFCSRMPMLSG